MSAARRGTRPRGSWTGRHKVECDGPEQRRVRVTGRQLHADTRDTPVWWPALFDALLSAALTRKVYVRLLVSKWAHTSGLIEPLLIALQKAADAGRVDSFMSSGQLEIKQFIIPGWDSTTGSRRKFPGHTRVNHTKYIVTDRRINIGTSNMTSNYFASTAGSSFNHDHPALVRTLQAVLIATGLRVTPGAFPVEMFRMHHHPGYWLVERYEFKGHTGLLVGGDRKERP